MLERIQGEAPKQFRRPVTEVPGGKPVRGFMHRNRKDRGNREQQQGLEKRQVLHSDTFMAS